jgi:hypothetical protein
VNLLATILLTRPALFTTAMAGGESAEPPPYSLRSLAGTGLLREVPGELFAYEAGAQARLKTVPWAEWTRRFAAIPRMTEQQFNRLTVWTVAIRMGDLAVLMPADRSTAPTAQLYTRYAGRRARLILSGTRFGNALVVSGSAVDSPLHCALSVCGAGEPCSGGCAGCTCGSFLDSGTHITACYCPDHDEL